MKKDSVFVWIMAMMLIATGVSLGARSSQASDLSNEMQFRRCGFHQMNEGDEVMNVRLTNFSENVMWFDIDVSVNAAHYYGSDGIARPGGPLKNVFVEVLAFDGNGNRLTKSFTTGHAKLHGKSTASASLTLNSVQALSQLVDLLVSVSEGTPGGFSFCNVWKYGNVYTGGASSQPKVYTVPTYPPPKGKVNKVPPFPPPSSNNLNTVKASYGPNRWPNDKVIGVRFAGVSGNVMSFTVDVSVDKAHINNVNAAGVYRTSPLTGVHVAVLPYDKKGKHLWNNVQSAWLAYPKVNGSRQVSTKATLSAGVHFTQVADLLVAVWETGPNQGTKVSFCDVVKWSAVKQPKLQTVQTFPPPKFKVITLPTHYAYMGWRQKDYIKPEVDGTLLIIENRTSYPLKVKHLNDNLFGWGGIQLKPGEKRNINLKAINLLNKWQAVIQDPKGSGPVLLGIYYSQ